MNIKQIYDFFYKLKKIPNSYVVVKKLFIPSLIIFFATATHSQRVEANINIDPLYMVYSADQRTGSLNIQNRTNDVKTYELKAEAWTLGADGKEVRTPTQDLRFSPSIIRLFPNITQVVRFIRNPSTDTKELRYRIRLNEISKIQLQGSGITYGLTLDFPWFFRSPTAQPNLTFKATGPNTFSVKNTGEATAQLKNLFIGEYKVLEGFVGSGYLLPGEEEIITLPSRTTVPSQVSIVTNEVRSTFQIAK